MDIGAKYARPQASQGMTRHHKPCRVCRVVGSRHGPGGLILPASRPVQELGTIEAGSKALTTASDDEGRPLLRSKSVRRSKALERRNG